MVQAIENWACLSGTVIQTSPDPSRANHSLVVLEVSTVQDVEGYPNLFAEAAGTRVTILVPEDVVARVGVERDVKIECRVSRRSPRAVVAHRDEVRRFA